MCRSLKSAGDVREFLGLSLSEVGTELARLTSRERPYTKQAVAKMERQPHVSDDVLNAYGQMLCNSITKRIGQTVGITLYSNSPWHVTPWLRCPTCGDLYPVDRAGVLRCKSCRSK
jgi:hypothetical protein